MGHGFFLTAQEHFRSRSRIKKNYFLIMFYGDCIKNVTSRVFTSLWRNEYKDNVTLTG